jgi:hypothetical protein
LYPKGFGDVKQKINLLIFYGALSVDKNRDDNQNGSNYFLLQTGRGRQQNYLGPKNQITGKVKTPVSAVKTISTAKLPSLI